MPRTEAEAKTNLICTRVTSSIKDTIIQQASQEGLTPSEWVRNLIVKELRERKALPKLFRVPEIEEKK